MRSIASSCATVSARVGDAGTVSDNVTSAVSSCIACSLPASMSRTQEANESIAVKSTTCVTVRVALLNAKNNRDPSFERFRRV